MVSTSRASTSRSPSPPRSAALLLLLPVAFLVCTTGSPTNPLGGTNKQVGGTRTTNLPTFSATATRFDLNADGVDTVVIRGTAKNPDGSALVAGQVTWALTS